MSYRFGRADPDGFARLYDEFGGLVYGCAYRVLRDSSLAEEAVQETFARAWLNADKFDHARPVAPWLAVIAKRIALDLVKRETRRNHDDVQAMSELAEAESQHFDDAWIVRQALDCLTESDRQLVRLMYYEDKSEREISAQLVIPAGTVKSRAHTVRQKLRKAFTANLATTNEPGGRSGGEHG
jgi:RNA polymerase sigma-70 factor, ECF subfamily